MTSPVPICRTTGFAGPHRASFGSRAALHSKQRADLACLSEKRELLFRQRLPQALCSHPLSALKGSFGLC